MPRILLVDDDEDIRLIAEQVLTALGGHEVATAGDGPEAVAAVLATHFDAVVLDVNLPTQDAATTLRQLRAEPAGADVPVVLLTAEANELDLGLYAGLDIAGVIPKPFDPRTLNGQLAEVFGW